MSARRVLIATAGGAGDVAPYTGLGARMRDAGFEVAIATHEPFAPMVEACGLEFRALPGDPRAALHGTEARGGLRDLEDFNWGLAAGLLGAAQEGTDVLLLAVTTSQLGYIVAEGLGLPSMGVFLQPTEPTRAFPTVLITSSLGGWGNRVSARAAGVVADTLVAKAAKRLRTRMGLAPASLRTLQRRRDAERWPICCGFSASVVPRPRDWRENVEVVGYWWPERPDPWTPPDELTAFLAAGPPPVCIGFGSLGGGDPASLAALLATAVRRSGSRAVVQSGWGGVTTSSSADILPIGDAPHDWLFPRMAAVVHAAGAGVTAAGVRAGVPAVPVPVALDQPFWGRRLVDLGVSPTTIPYRKLTADGLAGGLTAATTNPTHSRRAAALAPRLADEDGAGRTIELVRRHCS